MELVRIHGEALAAPWRGEQSFCLSTRWGFLMCHRDECPELFHKVQMWRSWDPSWFQKSIGVHEGRVNVYLLPWHDTEFAQKERCVCVSEGERDECITSKIYILPFHTFLIKGILRMASHSNGRHSFLMISSEGPHRDIEKHRNVWWCFVSRSILLIE